MKLPRRDFLQLITGVAVLTALPLAVLALDYPTRPVRIIVGFPAGGGADTVARLIGHRVSERLGQPFVVENRPGAASNIGAEAAARSAADGYTLLVITSNTYINATLYHNLKFDLIRDFAPVAGLSRDFFAMVVNSSVPARTVPDFIAYAKANPGKINMGSSGLGSSQHVAGELFSMLTGVDMQHVPYRGSAPAVTDLLGGQIQVMFDVTTSSIEHIKAGRLRALAVTSPMPLEALPNVPTVGDFVPGFEASNIRGLVAPKNTPVEIIDKLNREINAALDDPNIKARFAGFGATPMPLSPAEFGKLIEDEINKWAKVVKFANMKPE
ncbi:MAG TPA: tripartite tricarboxylate transporter substrate binding protein [Xanthobacteraceae bacterium]|nr:tripartite tricarboxylate transporter substrate binding protein [Xanthobacteraceae bacterium]